MQCLVSSCIFFGGRTELYLKRDCRNLIAKALVHAVNSAPRCCTLYHCKAYGLFKKHGCAELLQHCAAGP